MFAVTNVMKGERSWIGAMIVGNPSAIRRGASTASAPMT
jgi:hypothetical protein